MISKNSKTLQQATYGFVETGVNAVEIFLRLHLLVFYSKNMGLSTLWVGVALSLAILWDAAIDPWIGRFSDNWKKTKGTRLHLVLTGAILTSILLYALFHPPQFLHSDLEKWLYLFSTSLLLNTSYTFLSIPYSAMVGDYSEDRRERSGYIAWRMAFANLGAILGIAVPGYFLTQSLETAYGKSSWILAAVVLIATFIGSLTPPPIVLADKNEKSLRPQGILYAAKNKPFLLLVFAYFIVNIGLTFNSAAALFYYRLRLQISEQEIQNLLLIFLIVFSASIPLWILISRSIGRKSTLLIGAFGLGLATCVTYPLLPVGDAIAAYWWAAVIGGIFVGSSVLLESILTDVIDYDSIRSKRENFGLYFGLWKFSAKFSRATALLITGSLLEWANVAAPNAHTPDRLAMIFGPGVGFFFIAAGAMIIPFGLTEERCQKVKRILLRQKANNQTKN